MKTWWMEVDGLDDLVDLGLSADAGLDEAEQAMEKYLLARGLWSGEDQPFPGFSLLKGTCPDDLQFIAAGGDY